MTISEDIMVETQLLRILNQNKDLMTRAEIAHRLQQPFERISETIETLKNIGVVREARIEDLLREGK